MIATDGYPWLAAALVAVVVFLALGYWPLALLAFLLGAFFLNFFRDPERTPATADPLDAISPADGLVLRVADVSGEDRPAECADLPVYVAVFMNVFDVHVNRSPADGRIAAVVPSGGLKLAADDRRARLENERVLIRLETAAGPLAFVQIAGLVARRIVFRRAAGDQVGRGERVGLIKFGSRVDLYFPKGTEIRVREGERIRAGETIVARMTGPPA